MKIRSLIRLYSWIDEKLDYINHVSLLNCSLRCLNIWLSVIENNKNVLLVEWIRLCKYTQSHQQVILITGSMDPREKELDASWWWWQRERVSIIVLFTIFFPPLTYDTNVLYTVYCVKRNNKQNSIDNIHHGSYQTRK